MASACICCLLIKLKKPKKNPNIRAKINQNRILPAGVNGSSCIGDELLLLCGVSGGNELPCESMVGMAGAVAATRGPQKLKSNLLPDNLASRSRRHFSLSMCTCVENRTNQN